MSDDEHKNIVRELNERLIERTRAMLDQQGKLKLEFDKAYSLLRRCRDSAGRMEMGLYEDLQNFLHKHS